MLTTTSFNRLLFYKCFLFFFFPSSINVFTAAVIKGFNLVQPEKKLFPFYTEYLLKYPAKLLKKCSGTRSDFDPFIVDYLPEIQIIASCIK